MRQNHTIDKQIHIKPIAIWWQWWNLATSHWITWSDARHVTRSPCKKLLLWSICNWSQTWSLRVPSHHLKPLKVCENLRAATSREALLTKKSPRPPDFQGDISKIVCKKRAILESTAFCSVTGISFNGKRLSVMFCLSWRQSSKTILYEIRIKVGHGFTT